MSPKAQQLAIAEACPHLFYFGQDGKMRMAAGYHDYVDPLSDLNAMHEAEKTLTYEQKTGDLSFMTHLKHICVRDITNIAHWFDLVHATPAQRAEAFLRTFNLWDDSK